MARDKIDPAATEKVERVLRSVKRRIAQLDFLTDSEKERVNNIENIASKAVRTFAAILPGDEEEGTL